MQKGRSRGIGGVADWPEALAGERRGWEVGKEEEVRFV